MHQVEIRVKGQIDGERSDWFDGLSIIPDRSGGTIVTGRVIDQSALHGLLTKIRDLGLELVSVQVSEVTAITQAKKG